MLDLLVSITARCTRVDIFNSHIKSGSIRVNTPWFRLGSFKRENMQLNVIKRNSFQAKARYLLVSMYSVRENLSFNILFSDSRSHLVFFFLLRQYIWLTLYRFCDQWSVFLVYLPTDNSKHVPPQLS